MIYFYSYITLIVASFFSADLISEPKENINVFVVVAEECPICVYMTENLKTGAFYNSENVNYTLVFPNERSNYKTMSLFKKKYGLDNYEVVLDKNQTLTKKLGATITPEVIITDDDENVLFRGRVNDAYHAPGKKKRRHPNNEYSRHIKMASRGLEIEKPWPQAIGCYITFNQ